MIKELFLSCALALPRQKQLDRFDQLKAIIGINPEYDFYLTQLKPDMRSWKETGVTLEDFKLFAKKRQKRRLRGSA